MPRPHARPRLLLASILAATAMLPASRLAFAGTPEAGRGDLSGTWTVSDETDDDLFGSARKGTTIAMDPRRSDTSTTGAMGDLPLEAVTDARAVAIVDEGMLVTVTYPSGRKRSFFTDGEERQLDDGGGPAKIVAKRKGNRITVVSKWASQRSLNETWELSESPRRLVVTGKASGARETYKYHRAYLPSDVRAPVTPTPRPTLAPTPGASAAPDSTPAAAAPAVAPAGMAACSIHPPRGTSLDDLARLATISEAEAEKKAIAAAAGLKYGSVISSGVEVDQGCLVRSFDLRLPDKGGVQEIVIDAGDGKVLVSRFVANGAP